VYVDYAFHISVNGEAKSFKEPDSRVPVTHSSSFHLMKRNVALYAPSRRMISSVSIQDKEYFRIRRDAGSSVAVPGESESYSNGIATALDVIMVWIVVL
jgi:hypothetical protein